MRYACGTAVAVVLTIGACAVPRSEDPFANAGRSSPRGERMYLVQLVVRCDECTVTYQVAGDSRSERVFNQGFSRRLRLFPRYPQRISLSATGAGVRQVRILVDGEVAAEAGNDAGGTLPLHVETVIPLAAPTPQTDSLGSERATGDSSRR